MLLSLTVAESHSKTCQQHGELYTAVLWLSAFLCLITMYAFT